MPQNPEEEAEHRVGGAAGSQSKNAASVDRKAAAAAARKRLETTSVPPPEMGDPANVDEAIVAVMQNVGYVQKVKTPGLNYSFASERDLIAAIRPHMVAVGLFIHSAGMEPLHDDVFTSAKGTVGRRVVLSCSWKFTHAPSKTVCHVHTIGEAADYGDKAFNKAMTMALKYAIRQTFLIETGDDADTTPSETYQAVGVHMSDPKDRETPITKTGIEVWPPDYINALRDGDVLPKDADVHNVVRLLDLLASVSGWNPKAQTKEEFCAFASKYRAERIMAVQDGDEITPRAAATTAFQAMKSNA